MLENLLNFFLLGITLGLSAGLIPGPFQTIVIAQTIKHNLQEGIKVSLSVLITDVFFISITFLLLSRIAKSNLAMAMISFLGSFYLIKLAHENFVFKTEDAKIDLNVKPESLKKGMVTLFLSPGSWMFWFTLGGKTLVEAYQINFLLVILFLLALYFSFIGSNILVAFLVDKSRKFLQSKIYNYLIKFLGLMLLLFAILFFRNGLKRLGVV